MAQEKSPARGDKVRSACSRVFLAACALGVIGVVLYLAVAFVIGPREDPTGRCAFNAAQQINSDQVKLTWSENLLTNTLSCTWSSVDGKDATTVKLSAY